MSEDPHSVPSQPEPWLRGTLTQVPAVPRAVLHALQLAKIDLHHWCSGLNEEEIRSCPSNLPSIAFQIRHISRSLDRLLTYAEGNALSPEQITQLKSEPDLPATSKELFEELLHALERSETRILALAHSDLESSRTVGKKQLPTTLGGLLVHVADHTQRHVGQAVTTAKILIAQRNKTERVSVIS